MLGEEERDGAEDHEHHAEHADEPRRLCVRLLHRLHPVDRDIGLELRHGFPYGRRERHGHRGRAHRHAHEGRVVLRERHVVHRLPRLVGVAAVRGGDDADDRHPRLLALDPALPHPPADHIHAREVLVGERLVHDQHIISAGAVARIDQPAAQRAHHEGLKEAGRHGEIPHAGHIVVLLVHDALDRQVPLVVEHPRERRHDRRRLSARQREQTLAQPLVETRLRQRVGVTPSGNQGGR